MAGKGPAPKPARRRANAPARGDWQASLGVGWQHGAIPEPPTGLMPATLNAWATWFGAWFAAHCTPADLPGLSILARLYDRVERGEASRTPELRAWADTYGITPKGQQDRRWTAPKADEAPPTARLAAQGPYTHLRVVEDGSEG